MEGNIFPKRSTKKYGIKEGSGQYQNTWEKEITSKLWNMVSKGYYITCSINRCSIHHLEVFFQDKRGKYSPGAIWLVVKVLDMLKKMTNQGKTSVFWWFFAIKFPVTDFWCKILVSSPTTAFNITFIFCWSYSLIISQLRHTPNFTNY